MALLTTGLIENTPVAGIRPTSTLTVKITNDDTIAATVQIEGFFVTETTKTQYVLEFFGMAPGEVAERIYFAQYNEFEFKFITSSDAIEISAWGKDAAGNLVAAHRLVPAELDSIGPSGAAFRAVNNTAEQNVTADTLVVPVLYPDEIFDLNNEYDPVASTYTPKQDGVYSIIASVNFGPVVDGVIVPTNYRVLIVIRINGNPVVADNDFFGEIPIGSGITVSAILQLTAGDEVNVAAISSTNGVFFANPLGMHFEAARLPSPLINDPSTGITSSSNISSSGEL